MSDQYHHLASVLIDLEYEMRRLMLWSEQRPSQEALTSEEPFCVDTLTFAEWLQFIFIERMRLILEQRLPLPEKCGIAPMAEESFKHHGESVRPLITHLMAIDRVLSLS